MFVFKKKINSEQHTMQLGAVYNSATSSVAHGNGPSIVSLQRCRHGDFAAFYLNIGANWSSLVSCVSVSGLPCGSDGAVRDWQGQNRAESEGESRIYT